MKTLIAFVFTALTCVTLQAQNIVKERKVVQVIAPQTLYLNSITNGTIGGVNRTTLEIKLPKNTVEWYYSFSTSKDMSASPSLNLLSQVTKYYDPTGITAMATTALFTPNGVSVCDIYLLDKTNVDGFLGKKEGWTNSYKYIASGTRENFTNGTININNIKSGNYFLGFKNPSYTDGLSVTVEVVAIVEEAKIVEISDAQKKATLFTNLANKAYSEKSYDKALELYNKVIELNPTQNVYHKTGFIYLINQNYITAIDHYSTAIILAKKNKNAKELLQSYAQVLTNYNQNNEPLEGSQDVLHLLQTEIKNLK